MDLLNKYKLILNLKKKVLILNYIMLSERTLSKVCLPYETKISC